MNDCNRKISQHCCRSLHGDELFKYLKIYRDSLSDETEIKDVEELLKYYINNREGLIAYQSQGLNLPEHPDGLEYRNMGTMENHIWSMIAKRIKHNHTCWNTCWSKRGKSSGKDSCKEMRWKVIRSNRKVKAGHIQGRDRGRNSDGRGSG